MSITQLNEENIASSLLDPFAQFKNVFSFLLQNFVHLTVIVDYDLVIHLAQPWDEPGHLGTRQRLTSGFGGLIWN